MVVIIVIIRPVAVTVEGSNGMGRAGKKNRRSISRMNLANLIGRSNSKLSAVVVVVVLDDHSLLVRQATDERRVSLYDRNGQNAIK